jgi:hypothetical protein
VTRRKKRPNLRGCPICGNLAKRKVSGFWFCSKCNHKYGDGGLGRETERRADNGEEDASETRPPLSVSMLIELGQCGTQFSVSTPAR